MLLQGLVWLVRDGAVYVDESVYSDKEDFSFQSTGNVGQFVSVVNIIIWIISMAVNYYMD